MAIPLIWIAGAGVALLWAERKKKLSGDPPLFKEPTTNPLVLHGTGITRGGLDINSQLQRDRFVTGRGTEPTTAQTPPSSYYRPGGTGGKVPGFR